MPRSENSCHRQRVLQTRANEGSPTTRKGAIASEEDEKAVNVTQQHACKWLVSGLTHRSSRRPKSIGSNHAPGQPGPNKLFRFSSTLTAHIDLPDSPRSLSPCRIAAIPHPPHLEARHHRWSAPDTSPSHRSTQASACMAICQPILTRHLNILVLTRGRYRTQPTFLPSSLTGGKRRQA